MTLKILKEHFVLYETRKRAFEKIIIFTLVCYIIKSKFLFLVYYGTETSHLISMECLHQAVTFTQENTVDLHSVGGAP
jgi:hypothetical protein